MVCHRTLRVGDVVTANVAQRHRPEGAVTGVAWMKTAAA